MPIDGQVVLHAIALDPALLGTEAFAFLGLCGGRDYPTRGRMMDDQDDISIEKLRVDPRQRSNLGQPGKLGWQRRFTRLPREWELRLLMAKRISTYRLAIELLYLYWKGNGKPIIVSSKVAGAVKICARSKWQALAELERLGLIEVGRRPRRSPRAILLHIQTRQT